MIDFYMYKKNKEIHERGNDEECKKFKWLFEELDKSNVKRAVLFFKNQATYFEKDRISVLVGAKKSNIGAAEVFARKLIRGKIVDLSSIEEMFEFAEKVDKMSLDELAKHLR